MTGFSSDGAAVVVEAERGERGSPQIIAALSLKGIGVKSVDVHQWTLNEVFIEHVGKSLAVNTQDDAVGMTTRARLLRETRS